jgi:hypothetical protein
MIKTLFRFAFLMLPLALFGCGGAKVLKESEPLVVAEALASASDQRLSASLDWIIVRDGPGSWAKNVDWDEYVIRVQNLSADSIRVTNITVFDSLGTRVESRGNRKQLVKGTKKTKKRYKGEGLTVKAGAGAGMLLAGAAVAGGTAVGIGMATLYSSSAAATAGVAGGLILVPVFAVGGVMRGVNNSRVNKEIESRQTLLPIELQGEEERSLDIFFPLTPSPRQIELTYVSLRGEHTLVIDTHTALEGLHLAQAEE